MSSRLVMLAPLALLLVLFGLSNRHMVALKLWPFDLEWDTPLSVAVLLVAALAFLLGAGIAWASSLPHRRRARQMTAAANLLEAEVNELKGRMARDASAALPALGATPSSPGAALPALGATPSSPGAAMASPGAATPLPGAVLPPPVT